MYAKYISLHSLTSVFKIPPLKNASHRLMSPFCALSFCSGVLFTLVSLWAWPGSVGASTPGVDIEVQLLFNSSGTTYPTDFTRDIVPVPLFSQRDLTQPERNPFT